MAEVTFENIDIISNDTYAENGYPHAEWEFLRREAPLFWNTNHVVNPFWAVTRHDDLIWISKQPERFLNRPRLGVFPQFSGEGPDGSNSASDSDEEPFLRHLLSMDPPDHGRYRKLASHRFTPNGLLRMKHDIEGITGELLDAMGEEGEGDFVQMLSAPLPLNVLAQLLGVPRDMWRTMFQWTNQVAGSADPEYRNEGEDAGDTVERARNELFGYFAQMAADRRANPRDDITSVLANSSLDGAPVPDLELLSYYFLLVVAGNETTRNAMTGGLLALMENPGEWEKLKRDPSLVDRAAEEIVRWTTPVIQFCRTAVEDVEIRDKKIRAGESLCLFYPSANRDEDVFDAPGEFRVDRTPNRHVGFGIGEHFCLGANLARLELRVLLRHLAERLEDVELLAKPERLRSSFLGGIKRMPIRYRLRAA
jgi:cholest-4-en-3-one 26-monooxygenase